MPFLLAIDGGGTGCRAAVADLGGRVLARAEGGPANIASDPGGAAHNLLALSKAALSEVVGQGAVDHELARITVVMGLAGANVATSVKRLRAAMPMTHLRVETDAMIALKGALRDQDGIVAAIGTGSVFIRQHEGVTHRIGGRGFVLGDEGSGAWLGRALLSQALRGMDGFLPVTPLMAQVLDELGGMDGVIDFAFTARPADFARFARQMVGSDDPAAVTLMKIAERDIADSIKLLQPEVPLPVVFLGSLGQSLEPRFAATWRVVPPMGTALDGALWLARQEAVHA